MSGNQSNKRPVLLIPRSPVEIALEIAALVGVLCGILIIVPSWANLPDSIPIHFGFTGKPDVWGAKQTIWLLPAVSIFFYLLITIISQFPHTFNYPVPITEQNAHQQYRLARELLCWMKTEIFWLFAFLEWQMIQVALGKAEGVGIALVFAMLIVIFGTVGFYLRQAFLAR